MYHVTVECDRNSRTSKSVQTLGFLKQRWVFGIFLYLFHFAKISNFAVDCDQITKTPQNFQNLGIFWNRDWFFVREFDCFQLCWMLQFSLRRPLKQWNFLKRAKFVLSLKKVGFFNKKTWFLYKLLKVAKSNWK